MTVSELIEALQELNPDLTICREVNGDATRTGDYMTADGPETELVHPVSYGGYEPGDGANSETVVVIR